MNVALYRAGNMCSLKNALCSAFGFHYRSDVWFFSLLYSSILYLLLVAQKFDISETLVCTLSVH